MLARTVGVGLVAAGLLVGSAGIANADDQSYLSQIPPRTYFSMWLTDAQRIGIGYMTCGQLRGGMSPELAAGQYQFDGAVYVAAAQHELCPDTL